MPAWMRLALCSLFPTLPWLVEPQRRSPAAAGSMGLVCRLCPVHEACERFATETAVSSGFWAGADRGPAPTTGRGEDAA